MFQIRFSKPAKQLEPFVRFYVQRTGTNRGQPLVHPVPARAASMIEFDFADPIDVSFVDKGISKKSPPASVIGPQTYRRVDMHVHGTQDSFVVMFQPAGFRALFSAPMEELADNDDEAHAMLGASISHLHQRLGEESFEERVRLVNEWLSRLALQISDADGISSIASQVVISGNVASMASLAEKTGLGVRQFERNFLRKVGLSPKLFARIARFEAALAYKALSNTSWTHTAHHFGYYDQAHMNADFASFADQTPTNMLIHFKRVFADSVQTPGSKLSENEAGRATELIL